MARKMKKFADGGSSDRNQARYDRKVADIQSDYQKWVKSGRYGSAATAAAKRDQRLADAKDDLAKWTGGDRTQTRAAERASESALSEARRTKGASYAPREAFGAKLEEAASKPLTDSATTPAKKQSFGEAFAAARKNPDAMKAGKFTWNGKSYSTKMAGEGSSAPKKPAAPAKAQNAAPAKTQNAAPAKTQNAAPAKTQNAAPAKTQNAAPSGVGRGSPLSQEKQQKIAAAQAQVRAAQAPDWGAKMVAAEAQQRAAHQRFLPGGKINPDALNPDGTFKYKKGGKVAPKKTAPKKFAKGGSVDGCAIRGKTRAPMKKR